MTQSTEQERSPSAAPILRAMAENYPSGHLWDAQDAKTCQHAASEIERLHTELQAARRAQVVQGQKGDYLDGVHIPRLREALTFLGRGNGVGEGEVASNLSEYVNAITRAVMGCKELLRSGAPVVPQFNQVAQKKLNYLLEAGEEITGYAIQNKYGRRGAIDCHGFTYWWQSAEAPQPPDVEHIGDCIEDQCKGCMPSMPPVTPEEFSRDIAEMLAAPVQLPEPVAAESRFTTFAGDRWRWCTVEHARAFGADKGYEVRYLYTEQQVQHLLAAQKFQMDELAMLTRKLVQSLRKAAPDNESAEKALDYLKRKGLGGNPLRSTQEQST